MSWSGLRRRILDSASPTDNNSRRFEAADASAKKEYALGRLGSCQFGGLTIQLRTPATTHWSLVTLAARAYGGGPSCFRGGLLYDTENIARHLKAGVARMWANLTRSAAEASEALYQAAAAKIASNLFDKAQRKAQEEKPLSDESLPPAGKATSRTLARRSKPLSRRGRRQSLSPSSACL